MTRTSHLEQRIAALLHPLRDRRGATRGFAAAVASLAVVLLLTLAAVKTPLLAQQGRLAGTIKDASGAVVPKARVDVRANSGDESAYHEIVFTDEVGEFALDNVPDGVYDISVSKPGFARLEMKGVLHESSKPRRLEAMLNIGKVQEKMQVQAQRPASAPAAQPLSTPQRIKVGGNVQATQIEKRALPAYPVECKAAGIEGTVILKTIIGKDGAPLDLQQVNKQVDSRLVQSAMDAVRQWRWKPTLLNGEPVEVVTEVEINYTLTK